MRTVLAILFAVVCDYSCQGKLVPLANSNLEKINVQTSKDILNQILEIIEKTVKEQETLRTTCETKINNTIDSCESCSKNLCQPQETPVHEQILVGLVSTVNKPVTEAAKFINDIASKINLRVFENLGLHFYGKLGTVTNLVKSTLEKGGEKIFIDTIKELDRVTSVVAKETTKAVFSIGKWVNNFGGSIKSKVGRIFGSAEKDLNKFGSIAGTSIVTFGNGVVDTGKTIGNGVADAGKSIGNAFKGVFGKRSTRHLIHKRCVKSCPTCEILNTKKHTETKIVENICGTDFQANQNRALDTMKKVENIYNSIQAKKPIVTKVEFDSSTVVFDQGLIQFKSSFVTYNIDGVSTRFKFSGNFNIANINAMGVEISNQVRRRIF